MYSKLMKLGFILFFGVFITSCSILNNNSSEQDPALNKPLQLSSPRLLYQMHYTTWISTQANLNILSKPDLPTCNSFKRFCVPSVEDYQKNPQQWQNWHTQAGTHYRVLGLVPAGTWYHIYKKHIEDCEGCVPVLYIMIDSGSFKGTIANYRYDKTDEVDQQIVKTLSS